MKEEGQEATFAAAANPFRAASPEKCKDRSKKGESSPKFKESDDEEKEMAIPAETEPGSHRGFHTVGSSNDVRQLPASLASDGVSKSRLQNSTHFVGRKGLNLPLLKEQRSWCAPQNTESNGNGLLSDPQSNTLQLPQPKHMTPAGDNSDGAPPRSPPAFVTRLSLPFKAGKL